MSLPYDNVFSDSPPTERVWTVSQVTSLIKSLFDTTDELQRVRIRGEVTNVSKSSAGHIYFSLKDAGAALRCVAFKSSADRLRVKIEDGREIVAKGRISVWEQGGSYQLYVDSVEDIGLGALWLEFEKTRERLMQEGLFDEKHKVPLPEFPSVVGLVTSPDGAALRDMLRIFGERAPYISCILAPSLVQGDNAPKSLIMSLAKLEMWDSKEKNSGRRGIDLIIIGRGGGSFEDLACFNDENLARKIFECEIPIISAVGHEVDFTISDFVADVRAATPTQAAMIAAPSAEELLGSVQTLMDEFQSMIELKIDGYEKSLNNILSRGIFQRPYDRIYAKAQEVDSLQMRLRREIKSRLNLLGSEIRSLAHRLRGLDPESILSRGYSIAFERESGAVISKTAMAKSGMNVDLRVSDGTIKLIVDEEQ